MPENNANGLTQKEMLMLVLDGQEKINKRIDELHEKVNAKLSKTEFFSYIGVLLSLAFLLANLM